MRLFYRVLLVLLVALGGLLGLIVYFTANPKLPTYKAPQQLHYLDQWSQADRQTYYYTPQGTQVKGLRYNWFSALELPFSKQPFAAPEYLARFGFLVEPQQKASVANPGNLPVGFTRHTNPGSDVQYLDITCAACHTGELHYNGQALRIDGAPAQHVLPSSVPTLRGGSFGQALVASLAATYYNPWKFERFARTVLGDDYEAQHTQLRSEFKASLDNFLAVAWNDTHRGLYPTQEGPGRTDAFGRIANASFGDAISPDNYRIANAPVDYPHLWDMWTFDWVQWNASAKQPMARNIGEALGVGATLNFFDSHGQPLQGDARYPSSVRVHDLHVIEQTLQKLKPPAWPEALFGQVDRPLAAKGRALFAENCAGCHVPQVKDENGRWVQQLKVIPLEFIGTDPNTANNIADNRYDVSALQWDPTELAKMNVTLFPETDEPLDLHALSVAKGLAYITAFVEKHAYGVAGISAQEQDRLNGFGLPIAVQEVRAYKARPLDGIWATAPYLHNGSVPTLYQLLSPQSERDPTFYRGTFEYDPRHLGYRTTAFEGGFVLDTRISGNHNSGHEFRPGPRGNGVIGRLLQPEERWALLEYLKVLGSPLEQQLPTP
ncbi:MULTISPECIES: di-heme-cytochrome C peroxidase [unclassified Pseudomonas]|uniref:di-heme-cytochrome C peroxidase n=1 Tax=unclassified Pseudomonas TaxID=196821 RepID=UPI00075642F5|nr:MULTISPECIES: di-heme-cytochrome C peroxidase [unclassified Pseudomonas]KVV02614.1 Cytochrome c [Pseudomonas sp. TAD18]KVV05083.1 Cytochrome c [Pseudomonas sp. TAA207]